MKYQKTASPAFFLFSLLLMLNIGFANAAGPSWTLNEFSANTLKLDFHMPMPQLEEVREADQTWHILNIPGSAVHGSIGQPGLPVLSRLIAVPEGMSLSVEILSASSSTISNLQILPVQDPAAEKFSYSNDAYQQNIVAPATKPEIKVGRPAILAGQTVVPLTLNPVSYNPALKQARVWEDVRLKLEFIPDPQAPKTRISNRPLPLSFVNQLEKQVLGFRNSDLKSGTATDAPLGTYAAVHNGSTSVRTGIAPLLQWRRQQGYHVIELSSSTYGGSATGIKNALQNIYDDESIPPLEFVTIFGDVGADYAVPTWIESLSGFNGGGDHYYSTLDGDDILSDVHIGRVSFNTESEMTTVVSKILGYETAPPMDDTGWYGRACLQGDPSASGITTIYTNQWLKGQLLGLGWSQVDTTWSGNFASPMMAQVGAGASVYGYRGYYGTSGITNSHVEALNNGGRLAMALLPTCDSGSFAATTTCRSEAWLRAPNGGGIAAIGTATSGTHTRYNNCYYLGTWDALLNGDDHRIGVAHTMGKMDLYGGYFLAEPDNAEIWAVWNNVMGDAATEMWTGVPGTLDVDYPTQISHGAQALTISVAHEGMPVAGARVCLYKTFENTQISGLTDEAGQVVLLVPSVDAGSMAVTVTKHNMLPHLGNLTIGQVDVFCSASGRSIESGSFNPDTSVDIIPRLTNYGFSEAFGVSAELTIQDGPATVISGSLNFGNIASVAEVASSTAATIGINADAEDGSTIRLLITATNGTDTWTSMLEETVVAAAFNVSSMDLTDFGGSLDPGESGRFDLTLDNPGSLDATAVSATLSTDSPWVIINDDLANFGDIATDGSGQDLVSPFNLSISSDCFGGHLATFTLTVNHSGGMQTLAQCAVVIGTASTDEPTGPDNYGYYAFDNTDANSLMAPVYDWVAIDPDHAGLGTSLDLTDFAWEEDDTKTVTLPFDFGFYGTTYSTMSICSNGWMAMGETPVNFYRNFPFPSSHSAGAMIAPFWDNLYQSGNFKVYTWYDEAGHRFIVQWYGMNNTYTDSPQNFEAILLDPNFHPTSTGDGMIIFQYEEVNNTDSRDGYATVGIQNMDRTDGLNYSYWNQYAGGASSLVSGRAILFTPTGDITLPVASITPESLNQSLLPNQQVTEYLHISNTGDEGSTLRFNVTKIDPITQPPAKTVGSENEAVVEPRSLINSEVSCTTEEYESGATVDLPLQVVCHSNDSEWLMKVALFLPEGVTVNSAEGFTGGNGIMTWNGQTGEAVETNWGAVGTGSSGYVADGQSASTTLNLSFDPALTGDVVINWNVYGDNWGASPHEIIGQIVLAPTSPSITVSQPRTGDIAVLGEVFPIDFAAINGPELVNIDLQREEDGPWENLVFALSTNASPWNWTVTGEPGPYARIRVSDAADASVSGLSGVFAIGRNLDWVQLDAMEGEVATGQTMDLAVTLDATDLTDGVYEANLQITNNGGSSHTVTVALTVSSTSSTADVPTAVALLGNYPNPFNPQTSINFSLPSDQDITLRIYSARGRLVRSLLDGPQPAGLHHAIWDGKNTQGHNVASGVYFYRLETVRKNFTGKMVLAK